MCCAPSRAAMAAPNAGASLDPAAASDLLLLARDAAMERAPSDDAPECAPGPLIPVDAVSRQTFSSHAPTPLAMYIGGLPPGGIRTRTETQVRLVLRVEPVPLVSGPRAVVVLPAHLMAQPGAALNPAPADVPPGALALTATVVRAGDAEEGSPITACDACVLRERKRASRKRPDAPGQEEEISQAERERVILFAGTSRVVRLIRGEAMLPVRLTCYSRHHDERAGFRIRLDLWLRESLTHVAAAISPPILVTDDHKRAASIELRRSQNPQQPSHDPSSALSSRSVSPVTSVLPRRPAVLKVVPAEGPLHGGIEVCVLGEHFVPGAAVVFGAQAAPAVVFVNASTLLVRVPPAVAAGPVAVRVAGEAPVAGRPAVFFRYKNDLDHAMMEVALQLIGMRLTGRVDDARDVALRIISEFAPGCPAAARPTSGTRLVSSGLWDVARCLDEISVALRSSVLDDGEREVALVNALRIAGVGGEEIAAARTSAGHTIAHLAALAGWSRLLDYITDEAGFSAVHDMDASGVTPADITAMRASSSGCAGRLPSPVISSASFVASPRLETLGIVALSVHTAGTVGLWVAVALVALLATYLVEVRLPAAIHNLQ